MALMGHCKLEPGLQALVKCLVQYLTLLHLSSSFFLD